MNIRIVFKDDGSPRVKLFGREGFETTDSALSFALGFVIGKECEPEDIKSVTVNDLDFTEHIQSYFSYF